MVFDLGGGTLDVTIMEMGGGVFQVKSTSGDTQLGGTDMDNTLVEYITQEFKNQSSIDVRNDAAAMMRRVSAMYLWVLTLQQHAFNFGENILRLVVRFDEIRRRAEAHRVFHVGTRLQVGEYDDGDMLGARVFLHLLQNLKAILLWQDEIEKHSVRLPFHH